MTDRWVWWNGEVVPAPQARLDPRDRAVLYGVGLFETLRCYSGAPFALDAHWRRLRATADRIRLEVQIDRRRLARAITALLDAAGLRQCDASLRITLTGGLDGGGIDRPPETPPSILIHARPVVRLRGPAGLRGCRASQDAHRPIPGLKSIGYLPSVLARLEAQERGCDEAIVTYPTGQVLEGANSSVLARIDGRLVTPPLDGRILPSVTRGLVLELARREAITVVERTLEWEELLAAREVLCVGSVREIASIVDIEGMSIGSGVPGPWARLLFARYRRRALEECTLRRRRDDVRDHPGRS